MPSFTHFVPRCLVCGLAAGWLCLAFAVAARAEAADAPGTEQVAAKLLASTVTVRISHADVVDGRFDNLLRSAEVVTVCSGVSLGEGLIVTFSRDAPGARFRVTLPDGEQSTAEVRVVDTYSGLVLLQIEAAAPPGLSPTDARPPVGGAVLTAAAAGIEQPVVSLGILGAADRTVSGTGLPPLLQCDVRTTETSSGAAVVDGQGRLVGVIAATPGERSGWAYAIPARHVERLVRVRPREGYRVLRQQRPVVGLTMRAGSEHGSVEVERVEPGGPADQAGVRPGDLVLEAEGRKIRSPYQAVALIIRRQPGDTVELTIGRPSGQTRTVALTLGGAVDQGAIEPAASAQGVHVGPQLRVRARGLGNIELDRGGRIEEVAVSPANAPPRPARDELEMLRTQLSAFEKVILRLQAELERRDEQHAEYQQLIESLSQQVQQLRQQLDAGDDRTRE